MHQRFLLLIAVAAAVESPSFLQCHAARQRNLPLLSSSVRSRWRAEAAKLHGSSQLLQLCRERLNCWLVSGPRLQRLGCRSMRCCWVVLHRWRGGVPSAICHQKLVQGVLRVAFTTVPAAFISCVQVVILVGGCLRCVVVISRHVGGVPFERLCCCTFFQQRCVGGKVWCHGLVCKGL